jgi:DNA replication licensing factor MCM5
MPEKSKFADMQTLKMQENPEDVPAGEMPRNVTLCVTRNLVQKIVPGTRVKVMGVYTVGGGGGDRDKAQRGGGGSAVSQPYLNVCGLSEESEGARGDPHFSDAEHTEFKKFAARPFKDVIADIRARVAPAIFGGDDIKAAVATLLFSGSRKTTQDGARLRGDVNVLLMGDPSTAKSQFLKFVEKTAPICVYTSGKGSSAAGLTASVIRGGDGEFHLEGGAMVLADGGCVCIDEFDKMRDEDRVAIHEAMEQQTISIAKAGITTVLNSRAAVLAAANPPSVRTRAFFCFGFGFFSESSRRVFF